MNGPRDRVHNHRIRDRALSHSAGRQPPRARRCQNLSD